MRTLYLRNVPDEVADALQLVADREGMSLSAVAVRELTAAASVARNDALFFATPDLGIDLDAISAVIRRARDR